MKGPDSPETDVKSEGIYLRHENEFVWPFISKVDAERFLVLLEAFGGNINGISIVELSDALTRAPSVIRVRTPSPPHP